MAHHLDDDVIQWRKAQDWLYSTGKLSNRYSVLLDFALTLKDGVVLCEVASSLHPGSIKNVNPRPTIQFMCVKNIDAFLNSCIKFFGFQTHELFTATELLETENFGKVVELLSKLSHCNQAKNLGLKPFSCHYSNYEVYTTLQRDAESRNEDIYSRIEDFSHFDPNSDYGYQDSTLYPNESIYEDIVKIKQYRMDTPNDKRGYLIDEIFETEKNYVQLLEVIIMHFKEKLKPIFKMDDIKVIFHDIEDLKKVHEKLLQRLKLSIDNGGNTIGECFIRTEDQFYQYGPYCANLDSSSKRLDELLIDSKMVNIMNRCSLESKQRFGLKDLLRVPTQRILKYHLLLENLLKDAPHQNGLKEGTKVMKSIASYINEYKRNHEAKVAISVIEERIQNTDIDYGDLYSYGKLLNDGEIQLKQNNKSVKRYAFLFEQCILICCKMKEQSNLEIQVSLDFETYEISEKFDPPQGAKFSYGWVMKPRNRPLISHLPSYQMMVKTADQFGAWIQKIEEGLSILSASPAQHPHNFILKTFDKIYRCSLCDEVLCGVFAQGIICTACNIQCHRHCKNLLPECHKSKSISRGPGYHKELPSLPTTPVSTPEPYHVVTDGSPAVSPPPIPPRAPSVKGRRSVPNLLTSQFSTPMCRAGSVDGSVSPQLLVQGDLYVCTKDFLAGFISDVFEPTIQLNRGEFVEVIKKDHPMYWKGKSQSSGYIGYFPSENVKIYSPRQDVTPSSVMNLFHSKLLFNYPWYVGEMDRAGGRMMLEPVNVPDGCYLVRESQNRVGQFSIDVKFNFLVKHIKVVYTEDTRTYCLAPSKTFPSIVDLVLHYQRNTLGQVFRDLQTKLTVPYRCLPGS